MEKTTVSPEKSPKPNAEFESYLKHLVRKSIPPELLGMVEYHLGWKDENFQDVAGLLGKRGRPMLALLAYSLFNPDYRAFLPVAGAIELVHNCSLVFDDIQDQDTMRRGRAAVWSVWGVDEAINVGAAIQTLVWSSLLEAGPNLPPATIATVQRYLPDVMLKQCQGQEIDLTSTKAPGLLNVDDYLVMISRKTASLFEASGYLGAYCAGANRRDVESCRVLGLNIGLGFQILDDVVGIWGKSERGLDKPNRDMDHRKKTYPVICAYLDATPAERRVIQGYYRSDAANPDATDELLSILEGTGARGKAIQLGTSYLDQALGRLDAIRGDSAVKAEIADWVESVTQKQLGTL